MPGATAAVLGPCGDKAEGGGDGHGMGEGKKEAGSFLTLFNPLDGPLNVCAPVICEVR